MVPTSLRGFHFYSPIWTNIASGQEFYFRKQPQNPYDGNSGSIQESRPTRGMFRGSFRGTFRGTFHGNFTLFSLYSILVGTKLTNFLRTM